MFTHRTKPPDKVGVRLSSLPRGGNPAVGLPKQTNQLSNPLVELSAFGEKCGSTSEPGEFGPNPLTLSTNFPPAERGYIDKTCSSSP
jgi:hypothetical protein